MKWRRLNNIIHRDLGYLCFGLTLIYAISGVAVNHIAEWNPSYKIERLTSQIDTEPISAMPVAQIPQWLLAKLGETGKYKDSFKIDPDTVKIFVEGNTVTANLKTGEIVQEKVKSRALLYEMNFLHLNHPKKLWTWFADLYAIALCVLAVTGLFVLRGKAGIGGRGAWLAAAGLFLPMVFLWLYL